VVKHGGQVYVAVVDTGETPTAPATNYETDFVGVNYEASPWSTSALGVNQSISTSTGETIPNETSTTAMKLSGKNGVGAFGDFHATLTLEFSELGSIEFQDTILSETNWDYGSFEIDGVQQHRITASVPWTLRQYAVPAGIHVFKWRYFGEAQGLTTDAYRVGALRTVGSVYGSLDWEALT
jgi:hypothetical protein